MRTKFPGYYKPTEEDFSKLWKEGLFIFDANVLLDLYRYSDESVSELIKVIESIRDRIWIPFQVSKEYHKNLNNVISGQVKKYNESIDTLKKFKNQIDEKRNHPFLVEELNTQINEFCNKLNEELEKKRIAVKNLILNNPIKEKLADILYDKIGDSFSDEELEKIYIEAEKRYLLKIPPGYMDKSKPSPDKYNDFVIWKDVLKKSKEINQPILFITRDTKEDWYYEELELTIGPRPELIDEFYKNKNNLFYCYPTDQFLKYAKEFLNAEITDKTITEIGEYISQSKTILSNVSISEESMTEQIAINLEKDLSGSTTANCSTNKSETNAP